MNHITEALDLIAQNQLVSWLCVAVVVLIAGIALMVGYERAENKAAWKTARAENQEAKAIEAGRKLYEQAARNRED
jgi:uncharacterized protein (UPF0333 family)